MCGDRSNRAGKLSHGLTTFSRADRDCREGGGQEAAPYLSRAIAREHIGPASRIIADLERALRLGSADPAILAAVLRRHPDPEWQAYAARLLIANDRAGDHLVSLACMHVLNRGENVVLHARRIGNRLTGWVASRFADPPTLRFASERGVSVNVSHSALASIGTTGELHRWRFSVTLDDEGPVRLDAIPASKQPVFRVLPARSLAALRHPRNSEQRGSTYPTSLSVIVPLYGDPESLSRCLDALRRQTFPNVAFILIDDASPDAEVSRLGRDFCRDLGGLYQRHDLNTGFAAAINLGLSFCREGDVLLLNSDVILPDRALERLSRAAHSSSDIGIAAPLSNDAGNPTFPDPMKPSAPLPGPDAEIVDAAARRVNDGLIVDVPSALGSCLYITRACLDQVESISLAYGRGYFEDVDVCLRAQERGFRVVAACNVYVSHVSGRSFKDKRYALITRNGSILDARFPDHAAWDKAHDAADPLRSARGAIEEVLPPSAGPHVLLLGHIATDRPLMEWREQRLRSGQSASVLRLCWRRRGNGIAICVSSSAPSGPCSLTFTFDDPGRRRFSDFLATIEILQVEVFEVRALPGSVRDWLAASALSIVLVVDGREAASAVRLGQAKGERGGFAGSRLVAADERTAACLAAPGGSTCEERRSKERTSDKDVADRGLPGARLDRSEPARRPAAGSGAGSGSQASAAGRPVSRLGVLMPTFDAMAERLVAVLSSLFRRRGGPGLVVLGRLFDEEALVGRENVWVTGALTLAELPGVVSSHGVDGLFLPDRERSHWVLDVASTDHAVSRSFFDWSPGGLSLAPGDLALDPSLSDDQACSSLLSWCMTPLDRALA